jgi:hypothetical protein
MFYAFVVVCAATSSFEIDYSNCIDMQDTLGSYSTFELCAVRAEEMVAAVEGTARLSIMSMLGKPPLIYIEGMCSRDESEAA